MTESPVKNPGLQESHDSQRNTLLEYSPRDSVLGRSSEVGRGSEAPKSYANTLMNNNTVIDLLAELGKPSVPPKWANETTTGSSTTPH